MVGTTAIVPVLIEKFQWTDDELKLYIGIIGNMGMLGTLVGCLLAGQIMQYGRWRTLILTNCLCFLGVGIDMIRTVPTLIIGRLMFATGCGIGNTVVSKCIFESAPRELNGMLGNFTNILIVLGGQFTFLMMLILPEETE